MDNIFGYGGTLRDETIFLISMISTNRKGYSNYSEVQFIERLHEVSLQLVMRKSSNYFGYGKTKISWT